MTSSCALLSGAPAQHENFHWFLQVSSQTRSACLALLNSSGEFESVKVFGTSRTLSLQSARDKTGSRLPQPHYYVINRATRKRTDRSAHLINTTEKCGRQGMLVASNTRREKRAGLRTLMTFPRRWATQSSEGCSASATSTNIERVRDVACSLCGPGAGEAVPSFWTRGRLTEIGSINTCQEPVFE